MWGDGKQELKTYLTLHMKKKKKNYTDALSFQCQDHHGLKWKDKMNPFKEMSNVRLEITL